jgi:hypothetical protein
MDLHVLGCGEGCQLHCQVYQARGRNESQDEEGPCNCLTFYSENAALHCQWVRVGAFLIVYDAACHPVLLLIEAIEPQSLSLYQSPEKSLAV